MYLSRHNIAFNNLPVILAAFVVYPIWIWLSVRTVDCLRFVTGHTVPFAKRTVLLLKVLALIIGAGGIFGIALDLGLSWYFALLPAGVVVFLALREKTREIVVAKPPQSTIAYHSAWEEYRRLRRSTMRCSITFVAVFIGSAAFMFAIEAAKSQTVQIAVLVIAATTLLASIALMSYTQLTFVRWRCPRCGCAFRGLLWPWPFLPKRCRYCGLPRWQDTPGESASSTNPLG